MHTSADFLRSMRQTKGKATQFGVYVRGETPTAVRLQVPFLTMENAPQVTPEQHEKFRARIRARYSQHTPTSATPAPAATPEPGRRKARSAGRHCSQHTEQRVVTRGIWRYIQHVDLFDFCLQSAYEFLFAVSHKRASRWDANAEGRPILVTPRDLDFLFALFIHGPLSTAMLRALVAPHVGQRRSPSG